jgi:hypothetical protein
VHKYEGNMLLDSPTDGPREGGTCYFTTGQIGPGQFASAVVIYSNEVSFVKNEAAPSLDGSGGALALAGCDVTFSSTAKFENNSARKGDNIYVGGFDPSFVVFNGKSSFESVSYSTLGSSSLCADVYHLFTAIMFATVRYLYCSHNTDFVLR